jgi:hypothetical protein
MSAIDSIEFYLASEEAINGIMRLTEMSEEPKITPAVMKKTLFRFNSFVEKAKDMTKLSNMINLRTKKMNKIDKLLAWFRVLENENFHDEAGFAALRLRELGYDGPY